MKLLGSSSSSLFGTGGPGSNQFAQGVLPVVQDINSS